MKSKFGGDTVPRQTYERAARDTGLRVATWFDDSPMLEADVFQAFQIDRADRDWPPIYGAPEAGERIVDVLLREFRFSRVLSPVAGGGNTWSMEQVGILRLSLLRVCRSTRTPRRVRVGA